MPVTQGILDTSRCLICFLSLPFPIALYGSICTYKLSETCPIFFEVGFLFCKFRRLKSPKVLETCTGESEGGRHSIRQEVNQSGSSSQIMPYLGICGPSARDETLYQI